MESPLRGADSARPFGRWSDIIYDVMGLDASLPGNDLIAQGLADLSKGIQSVPALLVSIGAPRLKMLGIQVPDPLTNPEQRLYEVLRDLDGDAAHSRYNALIRRLVSFERAAACAR